MIKNLNNNFLYFYRELFRELSPWWSNENCDKIAKQIFVMNDSEKRSQINFKV